MKKILTLALSVGMVMAMATACGSEGDNKGGDTTPTKAAQESNKKQESKYYFEHNGAKVRMGDNGADAIAALGKENSVFTAKSCAFEGEDNTYIYDDFQVTLSTVDGEEVVTSVSVTSDMISITEGVKIGSTEDEVLSAMSCEAKADGNYKFSDAGTALAIIVKDGNVASITYSYE